jgi:hypothetical protein
MAFPTVVTVANNNDTANSLTRNATRAGSLVVGNLELVGIAADIASSGTTITMPSGGWTQLATHQFGSAVRGSVFYRVVDGSEGATAQIDTSASEATARHFYQVGAWFGALAGVEVSAVAGAGSTNPDPNGVTPSWGALDTLFITFAMNDGNVAITAGPANYTNFGNTRWANTAGCGVASARRELNAASDDPGVFTMATEQWVAFTVAIRPAAGGGGPTAKPYYNGVRRRAAA